MPVWILVRRGWGAAPWRLGTDRDPTASDGEATVEATAMRVTPIRTAAVLLVLAAGCAGPDTAEPPPEASSAATEHLAPDVPGATESPAEPEYSCFGPAIPKSVWAAQEPATDLEHPGRSVLLSELGPEGLEGWFLLEATPERLAVAREREVVREAGDDLLRTHDVVAVSDFGGGTGWHLEQWSSCSPQLVHDGVGPAEVWLDGVPDPDAREVDLLVVEMACASGASAAGRVELLGLDERADAVEVVVGVRAHGEGADCQSNPATPFTLRLQQPLGERTLIDGSVYPPRPLDPAPAGIQRV